MSAALQRARGPLPRCATAGQSHSSRPRGCSGRELRPWDGAVRDDRFGGYGQFEDETGAFLVRRASLGQMLTLAWIWDGRML